MHEFSNENQWQTLMENIAILQSPRRRPTPITAELLHAVAISASPAPPVPKYDQELRAFKQEHKWADMMDPATAQGFHRRWQRAIEIPLQSIEEDTDGFFTVRSCTDNGTHYQVYPDEGCNCPDNTMSTTAAPWGWCKHRLAVWLFNYEAVNERPVSQDLIDELYAQT